MVCRTITDKDREEIREEIIIIIKHSVISKIIVCKWVVREEEIICNNNNKGQCLEIDNKWEEELLILVEIPKVKEEVDLVEEGLVVKVVVNRTLFKLEMVVVNKIGDNHKTIWDKIIIICNKLNIMLHRKCKKK